MSDKELIEKYVPFSKQQEAIEKLNSGYPVQYIIGNVEFYGCSINVDENVLIPRFETEYLVDDLIKIINDVYDKEVNVLEVGTGSGCIAISLKKNINCKLTAIDISKEAIIVAADNAENNLVDIEFINKSIEEYNTNDRFDVLVSNPPYVPYNSYVDEKIKYEPQNAIYAEENGTYFYKIILEKSKYLLNTKNIIAFEIGDKQSKEIIQLAKKFYPNSKIVFKRDLNGYDRYIYIINE